MKKKQLLIALLLTISVFSCKKDDEDEKATPSLIGKWASSSFSITFINDKDYEMEGSGVTYERGTYTSTSDKFTLNNKTSLGCGTDETNATYSYAITDDKIKCTSVDDKCLYRIAVFNATFTKK